MFGVTTATTGPLIVHGTGRAQRGKPMSDGRLPLPAVIDYMNDTLARLGKAADFGVNADGWEFMIVNKYDKPLVSGKISPGDNVEHIARTEIHFAEVTVADTVTADDSVARMEEMEIPPGGTAKIKGSKNPWLTDWPAECAFWFKEPQGITTDAWCSIAIDVSTSVLDLGTVTRSTSTGFGSPLQAIFPPQDNDGPQYIYLQRA
jgi:hypothetical protein